jgi:hypothetical protein
MTFTDDLLDMMPDTVSVKAWIGMSTDGYGIPAYGAATTYAARIGTEQRLVRSFEGTEELSTTTVWVASTSTSSALDQWTFVDGSTPVLLAVETFRDEVGVTHSKLAFG